MGKREGWYALDNGAKLFPAVMSRDWATMFRLSLTLRDPVDPSLLQRALEDTVRRIPVFRLSVHRGVFWYYLDTNTPLPRVQEDVNNPCKKIEPGENGGYCFRVRLYGRRIALEVFHAISDGAGALVFLKTLAARYLVLRGVPIPAGEGVLDCDAPPEPGEAEDGYVRYARFRHMEQRRESRAYHPRMERLPPPQVHIVTGMMDAAQVKEKAGEWGVTVGEYLTGGLCHAFCCLQREEGRRPLPVKVNVPVNLRSFYPSQTLRNFALYVNPGVDPAYGEYSFGEIVQHVHHFMGMRCNEKYLNAMISANVGDERNPLLRAAPLFVKNVAMNAAYRLYGESRYSVGFSNLGQVTVPPAMEPHVERFDLLLGPPRFNLHAASAITYRGRLHLSMVRTAVEPAAERLFFTELVRQGIRVTVESNARRSKEIL